MRGFILLLVLCLVFGQGIAQNITPKQSPIVSTKKIQLKWQNQRDSLLMPVASSKYPALQAALCDTCLLFGQSLQTINSDYEKDGSGITSLTYKISYQDEHVISFVLDYETMAAHPDAEQHLLTLDIHTGKHHDLRKEISAAGIQSIFKQYINRMQARIPSIKILTADGVSTEDAEAIIENLKQGITYLKPKDLLNNYVFTKTGIKFSTLREIPYVFRQHDLNHDWYVSYAALRRYKLKSATVIK